MTTIRSFNDIADALGASMRQSGLIVTEADLCPEFFDLRTGLAGELLQKFVNYRARLAIVLADSGAYGERFSELVYEHRGHAAVRFFGSESDARQWLQDGQAGESSGRAGA
jgi:hypothetical protein